MAAEAPDQSANGDGLPGAPPGAAPVVNDPVAWLDAYGDLMWRYAMVRLRDRSAAEDLILETLVAARDAPPVFRTPTTEKAWLLKILRNRVAAFLRERERRARPPPDAIAASFDRRGRWRARPRPWPEDPDQVLAAPEFWEDLAACLGALPPDESDAVVLHDLRGIERGTVCGGLRITTHDLRARLHRGRLRLRRCIALKAGADEEERC